MGHFLTDKLAFWPVIGYSKHSPAYQSKSNDRPDYAPQTEHKQRERRPAPVMWGKR